MKRDEAHHEEKEGETVLEHEPVDGTVHRAVGSAQGETRPKLMEHRVELSTQR